MRITWLVLGVVVAAGAVAFINTDEDPVELPSASGEDPGARPVLNRPAGVPVAASAHLSEADARAEKHARALLTGMARAKAEGNRAKESTLAKRLRQEAWDAPSSRRWAYVRGHELLDSAGHLSGGARGAKAIEQKDRARRLLSRVLYLPEMFKANGASTDERTKLIQTIQKLNRQVMHYEPGVAGVTRPYLVPSGIVPVQIISRQKLSMGSNAILFWNQGPSLDPKRLRADQTLLLPLETLSLHVHLRLRRLGIFIGDWFVKEFRVGVGKEETPTPLGTFSVHSRERNPDWWQPGGKRIRYGDPRNELGSAWIAIVSDEWPVSAGYGIHGTNKPRTVGTRCSNGCVRLANPNATELYDWVRTASRGGKATEIVIQ